MEDAIISLQNIANDLERIGNQLERIADQLERIETRLNNKIIVELDLERYCWQGDPYIRVHGKLNVDQRSV